MALGAMLSFGAQNEMLQMIYIVPRQRSRPSGTLAERQTTIGCRAFSVAGPTVWNSLPDELRDKTENTLFSAVTEDTAFQTILVCSAH